MKGDRDYIVHPSPFSRPFNGSGEVTAVRSIDDLREKDVRDKIAVLTGDIAKEPLMPKNFPFYFPDHHAEIIDLLETKRPKALIAGTGEHPIIKGFDCFTLFEDSNFIIPGVFTTIKEAEQVIKNNSRISLIIDSRVIENIKSRQLKASRKSGRASADKIIICAHMDTKYGTPGALDNAGGVTVLLKTMEILKDFSPQYDLEFVPFNGEEYPEVMGQLKYLNSISKDFSKLKLVINIDGAGHKDGGIAYSTYNFNEELQKRIETPAKTYGLEKGPQWVEGDHSMFVMQGIPSIAITSTNMFHTVAGVAHTENDTEDLVSCENLEKAASFIAGIVTTLQEKLV